MPENPYHPAPNFSFPRKQQGDRKRSAHSEWFQKWSWLSYDVAKDAVFCFPCKKAYQKKLLLLKHINHAFVSRGFNDWKEGTRAFQKHEKSQLHIESVDKVFNVKGDIGEVLSVQHQMEKEANQRCLRYVVLCLRYLARQTIALRGDNDEGNFKQLLKMQALDNKELTEWLEKKREKFTSPEIQNEILKIMAHDILRNITSKIRSANFFSIMIDETVDVANKEQCIFVVRWVDDFDVHEEFLGLYECDRTTGDYLVLLIKDMLKRFNFSLANIRGQNYDGAASMTGKNAGVKSQILREEPRALFVHCYGHSTNLAVCDALKKTQIIRDGLDFCKELIQLIKYSPKREAILRNCKNEDLDTSPGIRTLCPTRWTVKSGALTSILSNYGKLLEAFEEALLQETNPEMKARINGVKTKMETFEFFFAINLAAMILAQTDNLAKALQKETLSAVEGKQLYQCTVLTLRTMNSDETFEKLWEEITKKASDLGIGEPEVPKKRRKPIRYRDGEDAEEFPATAKERYKKIFIECFDNIIKCLEERFEQKGQEMYSALQNLLLLAAKNEDYEETLKLVLDFYKDDFNENCLKSQLLMFKSIFPTKENVDFPEIISYFKKLKPGVKSLLTEVCKVMELILVLPATNANSERGFSKLRLVKTYLRSTMTQGRLNHLMILSIYKDMLDNIDLDKICNEFVTANDRRSTIFGKF